MSEADGLEPLFPDRSSPEPLGRQLARRLRHAIETGFYKPRSRLLPSRELATRLGLSRHTVTAAIDQLIAEGYLESRVGSGTFVVASVVARSSAANGAAAGSPPTAERLLALRPLFARERVRGPLRAGIPDLSEFPYAAWARLVRRTLAEFGTYLDYGDSSGERPLRVAIAQHVAQFRGITADPRQVIVVSGTQEALSLAADVLSAEGDAIVLEDPCYWLARATFAARDLRLEPVPVDADGLRIADAPPARLAYVTPSHQYPLAAVMSLERRRELLAWAHESDAYVVEDDYDSEFSFDAKPLPALQSMDREGRVIYIGSFSKTLAPGLRIAYVIVPPHLARAFAVARHVSNLGDNRSVQATLAGFLAEGHFARHVRRMTRIYAGRRRALLEVLRAGLPGTGFTIGPGNAGLHLAVVAPPSFDDAACVAALAERGVAVEALSAACIRRTDCRGFLLGFSAAPADDIAAAGAIVLRAIG